MWHQSCKASEAFQKLYSISLRGAGQGAVAGWGGCNAILKILRAFQVVNT